MNLKNLKYLTQDPWKPGYRFKYGEKISTHREICTCVGTDHQVVYTCRFKISKAQLEAGEVDHDDYYPVKNLYRFYPRSDKQ
jgi:hypothetical protein